jgi:hypothetical protein
MPKDINGKEPGQKGYTFQGLPPNAKKQAQAIAISKAEKKYGPSVTKSRN